MLLRNVVNFILDAQLFLFLCFNLQQNSENSLISRINIVVGIKKSSWLLLNVTVTSNYHNQLPH